MRKGDRLPLTVGGIEIGYAEVESFADGKVTIFVPAQRAVAGVRMQLEDVPKPEPTTETIITGVDRPATAEVPSDVAPGAVASAQPVAQPEQVLVAEVQADGQAASEPVVNSPVPPTPDVIIEAVGGQPEPVTQAPNSQE